MLADPGDDLLGVDLVAGESGLGPQPVVGADAHPPLAGEPVEQGPCLAVLRSAGVAAAVEVDQDRCVLRRVAAAVDVEEIPAPGVPVADVGDPLHVTPPHQAGQQQDEGPGPVTAERYVHTIPPAGPETLLKRSPDHKIRAQAPPGGDSKADGDDGGHRGRHLGAR